MAAYFIYITSQLYYQHCISVRTYLISLFHRNLISIHHILISSKGTYHHKQCRMWFMFVIS